MNGNDNAPLAHFAVDVVASRDAKKLPSILF
jgi:hypothetical protein